MTGDGKSEAEVQRRNQVGANSWRRVEGLMVDRKISRKLKGKVLILCIMPAYLDGLQTGIDRDNNRGCRFATIGSEGLEE